MLLFNFDIHWNVIHQDRCCRLHTNILHIQYNYLFKRKFGHAINHSHTLESTFLTNYCHTNHTMFKTLFAMFSVMCVSYAHHNPLGFKSYSVVFKEVFRTNWNIGWGSLRLKRCRLERNKVFILIRVI